MLKKALSLSFLVRPQHKQLYPEDLSVFAPFRYLGIRVGQSKGLVKKYSPFGTKMTDSTLKQSSKLHDPASRFVSILAIIPAGCVLYSKCGQLSR